MLTIILLIAVSSPDGVYVHQRAFDNAIECQMAKDDFNYRAELTRTTGDTIINECIDYSGSTAGRD